MRSTACQTRDMRQDGGRGRPLLSLPLVGGRRESVGVGVTAQTPTPETGLAPGFRPSPQGGRVGIAPPARQGFALAHPFAARQPQAKPDGQPEVARNFYIGGYQPAQKWLKDRKGRELSFDDIKPYRKIIKILTEADRIMKTITMPLTH